MGIGTSTRAAVELTFGSRAALAPRAVLAGSVALLVAACDFEPALPLDLIGAEQTVIETYEPEDLADKHPQYDPELNVIEDFDGCRMRLNKSASVTRLTVKELDSTAADLKDVIFPTRGDALAALGARAVIPSMEVVNGALKPWNDGLYATVERIAEHGREGSLVNKRATLDALLSAMLGRAERGDTGAASAAAHFAAAVSLSGGSPQLPPAIEASASSARAGFQRDLFRATPIGFYTWTAELSTIFQRDRFLQGALPLGREGFRPAAALAQALAADAGLLAGYRSVLELYRGMTNPLQGFDALRLVPTVGKLSDAELVAAESIFASAHPELDHEPPCQAGFSWLPPSDSPERKLIAAQTCAAGTPPQNLLDALIGAIQSGAIDLMPNADSGWYDWQLYALETLLLPERGSESQHLLLTQKYRDKLVETFKALLIQTRETHVKQLGPVATNASHRAEPRQIDIYPALVAEPFPTFYLRTARGYDFLRNVLAAALGRSALELATRMLDDGTESVVPLADELASKIELMYGLHLVAAASIGMRDELTDDERARFDPESAERAARRWLEGWRQDHDVLSDPRVALPLVLDGQRGITQNLAVVGVKAIQISASYPKGSEPEVTSAAKDFEVGCVVREFVAFEPYMLVEQTLEFERSASLPPLTRDALRTALNGKRSLTAIRTALEAP